MHIRQALVFPVPLLHVAATTACTVNRRVEVAPELTAINQFLEARRPADIQVTDMAGKTAWLHSPRIEGDSPVGVASRKA